MRDKKRIGGLNMERIAIGFVTEPSFLNVTPMVEQSNQSYEVQQILPMTKFPSPHFSKHCPLYSYKGKTHLSYKWFNSHLTL
ncbi:hypothetical protein HMPREF3037_02520 [Candidatus Stoquefichus sp. KLE1796]|nr:hypothetical protein HMPREF3037_02520 [Candidatus Stoquefichus sp. KLE1796]